MSSVLKFCYPFFCPIFSLYYTIQCMPDNGIPKNWPCDVEKGVRLTDMGQLKSNIEIAGISGNKFDVEVRGLKSILTGILLLGDSTPVNKESSGNQNLLDNDLLPNKIIKHYPFQLAQYQLPCLEISRK